MVEKIESGYGLIGTILGNVYCMETKNSDKLNLISNIESDAEREAEEIVVQAEKQAQERKKYAEMQVQSITKDAEERAQKQSESVERTIMSSVKVEVKRKILQVRVKAIDIVLERVRAELSAMQQKSAYRNVLQAWIVEGVLGLESESVLVNASAAERKLITDQMLADAERKIKKVSGRGVNIKLSPEPALKNQGIMVTAEDGRTAFNNQVEARIARYGQRIQNEIFDSLFNLEK
jgi:vacuolar-type H+-ATPase subunit E/Vma4